MSEGPRGARCHQCHRCHPPGVAEVRAERGQGGSPCPLFACSRKPAMASSGPLACWLAGGVAGFLGQCGVGNLTGNGGLVAAVANAAWPTHQTSSARTCDPRLVGAADPTAILPATATCARLTLPGLFAGRGGSGGESGGPRQPDASGAGGSVSSVSRVSPLPPVVMAGGGGGALRARPLATSAWLARAARCTGIGTRSVAARVRGNDMAEHHEVIR